MSQSFNLTLALVRGLGSEARLALRDAASGRANLDLDNERCRRRLATAVGGVRFDWPSRERVRLLASAMASARIEVVWRGERGYPAALAEELGEKAPACIYLRGDSARATGRQCAFVGSRQTERRFGEVARRLARALSTAGVAITSGMAEGADAAAHEGGLEGTAGTIVLPARGLLRLGCLPWTPAVLDKATFVGLAPPDAGFNAGLAIARDYAIAALSGGVVLVASGLRGGSAHAVCWALKNRRPVWCFEAGRKTPEGNRSLIRSGHSIPLPIDADPGDLAQAIIDRLDAKSSTGRRSKSIQLTQTSLFAV